MLTVNKMDRCFLELQQDGEQAYSSFLRVIESANVLMSTYADEALGDTQVYPEKGTVCFSAGLHNWAFNIGTFAKVCCWDRSAQGAAFVVLTRRAALPQLYASKFSVSPEKMSERLWGENFFDPATKTWTKKVCSVRFTPLRSGSLAADAHTPWSRAAHGLADVCARLRAVLLQPHQAGA